ncbi:O-antigen ligase [Arthrobacter oryzae]|uniref:hypothetical protein n=1 Tax=Arthrobacter oryzae TaxID=409290 RepID=UPI00278B1194|nr:hypothetical protein [Arthrobacter oryzae]MDP9986455.1 O-antigen ligase [Arthrobacter oryzae]
MTTLLLIGGLSAFVLLSMLAGKAPQVLLYALTVFAVASWDWPNLPALANLGGASVYVEDVAAGAMIVTVVARPQRFWEVTKPFLPVLIVTGLSVLLSVGFGVALFGPKGVNEFRTFLYPLAAAAWGLNQEWRIEAWKGAVRRWVVITGALLSLVAMMHIALYGLGSVDSFVTSKFSGALQTGRPLTAGQAVLLALCGVYLLQGLSNKNRRGLWWSVLFIGITLVAQHRSVWIALAAGLVVLFFKVHGVARARVVVAAVVAAWGVAVLALSGIFNPFSEKFTDQVENLGTYGAREDSWTTLIGQNIDSGLGAVVFSSPFGSGFHRVENGVYVDWAPHNWYVTVYLRLGLAAIAVFAVLLLVVSLRLLRTRDVAAAAASFAVILVFCWAYSMPWYIAPFFAWAMWSASKSEPRQVTERLPRLPAAYQKV